MLRSSKKGVAGYNVIIKTVVVGDAHSASHTDRQALSNQILFIASDLGVGICLVHRV